ncbi:RseA family anti-sigma factor [Massilia rubra]|uniref:RseA family anti-sigma factor n=1 Tax=Massilia rubra TaxID=2607910 RepID=UPI0016529818|nr:RseA family anti-sigma factor [Massilia rubra]
MDTPKTIREQISAFSDHELAPSTLPDDALRSAEGEHAWHAYHRIRDVIREQGAPHLSAGFADKLAARLAAEPTPAKRLLRAAPEALARRAPAVTPLAVAAGAAGPVTGIGAAPGESAGASAGAISESPLDLDGQALAAAPHAPLDALDISGAAAEASIAPGAAAVTIAVVKAAANGAADVELNAGGADVEAGAADGVEGGADPKADVTIKPPITSVS